MAGMPQECGAGIIEWSVVYFVLLYFVSFSVSAIGESSIWRKCCQKWAVHPSNFRIVYLTARVFEGAVAATHEWLFHRGHGFPSGQVVFTSTANEKIAFLAGSGVSVNLAQAEADAGAALAAGTSIVSSGDTGASPGGERGGGAGEGNSINNFGSLVDLEDDNLHAAADNFSVASSSRRNAVEPFLDRILIDDLTRAHHKQRFELQEKLLTMLPRYQQTARVWFVNASGTALQLFWLDQSRGSSSCSPADAVPRLFAKCEPHSKVLVDTFVGHSWRIRPEAGETDSDWFTTYKTQIVEDE
eukprot:g13789.t1